MLWVLATQLSDDQAEQLYITENSLTMRLFYFFFSFIIVQLYLVFAHVK